MVMIRQDEDDANPASAGGAIPT